MGCIAGHSLECMKLLIKAHADVNIGGFNGMAPLFLACSLSGSMTFVKFLLDAGADPNVTDELGRLPIEVAAADAETEFIEALFPVTRRPPTMLDWSVVGIVRYVNSVAYKERVITESCIKKDQMKEQGHSAFKRKDYNAAILFYNLDHASAYDTFLKALKLDPKSAGIIKAIRDVSARRNLSLKE